MDTYEHFDVEDVSGVAVVHLRNPADADELTMDATRDELAEFVEREKPNKLLVDFGNVEVSPSAQIGALLDARRRLTEHGGSLRFCGMNKNIRSTYRQLSLDGVVFRIYDEFDEAIEGWD